MSILTLLLRYKLNFKYIIMYILLFFRLVQDFEEQMLKERTILLNPGRPSTSDAKATPRAKSSGTSEYSRKRGRASNNDLDEYLPESKRLADESSIVIHKVLVSHLKNFLESVEDCKRICQKFKT